MNAPKHSGFCALEHGGVFCRACDQATVDAAPKQQDGAGALSDEQIADAIPTTATILPSEPRKVCMTRLELRQFAAALASHENAGAVAFQKALDIRIAQGWQLGGNACPVLYTDTINGEQVCRDDLWLATTAGLKGAPEPAPRNATAEEDAALRDAARRSSKIVGRGRPEAAASDDAFPFYELKFIMRVLGHKGGAPKADWDTAYGMAREVFIKWHADKVKAEPAAASGAVNRFVIGYTWTDGGRTRSVGTSPHPTNAYNIEPIYYPFSAPTTGCESVEAVREANNPRTAYAIELLVAAGHVTREKADEAYRIACETFERERLRAAPPQDGTKGPQ